MGDSGLGQFNRCRVGRDAEFDVFGVSNRFEKAGDVLVVQGVVDVAVRFGVRRPRCSQLLVDCISGEPTICSRSQ